jgi:hypothetical protein
MATNRPATTFVSHLRQIFYVYVVATGFMGLEAAVLRPHRLVLTVAQISHPMPTQAAVQARPRGPGVEEFPHHGKQVVKRHQQRRAERDGNDLLCRRQGRLKSVRRVTAILDAITLAPFADRLRRDPEAFRKNRPRLVAGLNDCANLGRRRRLLVKMHQHADAPFRLAGKQSPGLFSAPPHSRRTGIAMKRADRRGEM